MRRRAFGRIAIAMIQEQISDLLNDQRKMIALQKKALALRDAKIGILEELIEELRDDFNKLLEKERIIEEGDKWKLG